MKTSKDEKQRHFFFPAAEKNVAIFGMRKVFHAHLKTRVGAESVVVADTCADVSACSGVGVFHIY